MQATLPGAHRRGGRPDGLSPAGPSSGPGPELAPDPPAPTSPRVAPESRSPSGHMPRRRDTRDGHPLPDPTVTYVGGRCRRERCRPRGRTPTRFRRGVPARQRRGRGAGRCGGGAASPSVSEGWIFCRETGRLFHFAGAGREGGGGMCERGGGARGRGRGAAATCPLPA